MAFWVDQAAAVVGIRREIAQHRAQQPPDTRRPTPGHGATLEYRDGMGLVLQGSVPIVRKPK